MTSLLAYSFGKSSARRVAVSLMCVLALMGATACSAGSKTTSSEGSEAVSSESTSTTAKSKDYPFTSEGVAQQLADVGVGCADYVAKVDDPTKTKTTLAPEPASATGSCTVDGTHLTVTVFASKSDEDMASAQLKTVYAAVAKSLGITQLTYIHAGKDERVWISIGKESGGDKGVTPEQEALLNKVAKTLNGKVVKVDL